LGGSSDAADFLAHCQPTPARKEIFLHPAHPDPFVILNVFFKITCAILPSISHCHTVSDFAQKQALN
jgi:hypothetical protein